MTKKNLLSDPQFPETVSAKSVDEFLDSLECDVTYTMERLAKYMDGRISADDFEIKSTEPKKHSTTSDDQGNHLMCAISWDQNADGERQGTFSAFNILKSPTGHPNNPCVRFERDHGRWVAMPYYCGRHLAETLLDAPPWVSALVELVDREMKPLLSLIQSYPGPNPNERQEGALMEVQTLVARFDRQGPMAFFSTESAAIRWEIATEWPAWDDQGLSEAKRLLALQEKRAERNQELQECKDELMKSVQDLAKKPKPFRGNEAELLRELKNTEVELRYALQENPEFPVTTESFRMIYEEMGLVCRTPKRAGANGRKSKSVGPSNNSEKSPPFPPRPSLLQQLVRASARNRDPLFSRGGDPFWTVDNDPEIGSGIFDVKKSKNKWVTTKQELMKKFWWWKALPPKNKLKKEREEWQKESRETWGKKWEPEQIELFSDNWEQSAFFYELRARFNDRYQWDPFHKPWVKLTSTERGILASIWPPRHIGCKTLRQEADPLFALQYPSEDLLTIQVDLDMADSHIIKLVQEKIRQAREAYDRKTGNLSHCPWLVLELLDRHYFLDEMLTNTQRRDEADAWKEYRTACEEAGIDP